ncbi:hypothetical protein DFP72DRAFT_903986 [Ephemerocybe angulata]|uniref:Uncharacterized protein n=1 Tax=Ephemerocybe angulata TaxID=980116 RepID=A0A8H6HW60_9AGAR|nr:hypothetical protein DFP72DRAFT_903986 [Tulosesus angulatus]
MEAVAFEIVADILGDSDFHNFKYLYLRLVCKRFRIILEPLQFKDITIYFKKQNIFSMPEKLSSLAAGNSPYARWATKLKLRPWYSNKDFEKYDGPDLKQELARQTLWLVRALQAMPSLQSIQYSINSRIPRNAHAEILTTLSRYPDLKELCLDFAEDTPMHCSLLPTISNLRSLEIRFPRFQREVINAVNLMIAQSPAIQQLKITQTRSVDHIDLSAILEESTRNKALFKPSLEELRISSSKVKLTPSCVPFLLSLRRLTLDRGTEALSPFWRSLIHHGVQIQALQVHRMTPPILEYLLSCPRLCELKFHWPKLRAREGLDFAENVSRQFFDDVLPLLSPTLQVLRAIGDGPYEHGPWCACKSNFQWISKAQGLRELEINYHFPLRRRDISLNMVSLDSLLSAMSDNLLQLETLILKPVWVFSPELPSGFDPEHLGTFGSTIPKAVVQSSRPPGFRLKFLSGRQFTAVGTGEGKYRFVEAPTPHSG